MSQPLKDCYFCGSKKVEVCDLGEGRLLRFAVECKDCLACGPFKIDAFRAALAWNRANFGRRRKAQRAMDIFRLGSGKQDSAVEEEWHCNGSESEFTACGMACTDGATDRIVVETKKGRLRDVTCQHCHRVVEYYKRLR